MYRHRLDRKRVRENRYSNDRLRLRDDRGWIHSNGIRKDRDNIERVQGWEDKDMTNIVEVNSLK